MVIYIFLKLLKIWRTFIKKKKKKKKKQEKRKKEKKIVIKK